MNLRQCVKETETLFRRNHIASAHLDALILLEIELKRDRAWILAHLDDPAPNLSKKFAQSLRRRVNHEPIAYIIGKSEFYGREFTVNNHTLVPRPETETMIELAKKNIASPLHIIDVGCGSGAIGITAYLENLAERLTLLDIDSSCLKISAENAVHFKVKAELVSSNLLEKIDMPSKSFVIMANLPYVPDTHTINEAAMFEPKHAIFGGIDGLDLYRSLFEQTKELDVKPTLIFTESLPPQHQELVQIAEAAGYRQLDEQDFIQIFTNKL